jgi:hypothetical protein
VLERDAELVSISERDALQRAKRGKIARIFHAAKLRLRRSELARRRALGKSGLAAESHDALGHRGSERIGTARLLRRSRCDRCWCRFVRHGDKRVTPALFRGENVQKIA